MKEMVSIIIPHFNRLSLLREAIDSVKGQTYTDWEIVIVDDKSEDDVYNELRKLESDKIHVYQRENETKGPSACRNIGARKANGKYLIFLDSDDLLKNYCLEQRVGEIENNVDLEMGVFLMEEFETLPGDLKTFYNQRIQESQVIASFIRNKNPWQTMAPIWRKEFFMELGGFDEDLLFMEDPELHLRALLKDEKKIRTFYDHPADCFYRMNHFDEAKEGFYYNSILYRIRFYQKLTSGFYPREFVMKHSPDIKTGVNQLVKTFLYSRVNQFPELYEELMRWMKSSGIYSTSEAMRYRLLIKTGNTENRILKAMKVRGMCYRMLPSPSAG